MSGFFRSIFRGDERSCKRGGCRSIRLAKAFSHDQDPERTSPTGLANL